MLFMQALVALLVYDILQACCPFQTMYSTVKGWRVVGEPTRSDITHRVCRAVDYSCIWYPKRALCLQRSFVTTYLLRKHGIPARMALGAQQLPFKAHAWVEVDGKAINERSNVHGIYTVWDRC
jgi:Transglutaminase-like superfamily